MALATATSNRSNSSGSNVLKLEIAAPTSMPFLKLCCWLEFANSRALLTLEALSLNIENIKNNAQKRRSS